MPEAELTPTQQAQVDRVLAEYKQKLQASHNPLIITPQSPIIPPEEVIKQMPPPQVTKEQYEALVKQFNSEKLIAENKDKIEDAREKQASYERAEREPLPANTIDAFSNEPLAIKVGDKTINCRKMVAIDITIFKLMDSPFYKLMVGEMQTEDSGSNVIKQLFPDEELLYDIVYQFTNPAKEVYKLAKKGKEALRDTAIDYIVDYTPNELVSVAEAILRHVGFVNEARVQFEAPNPDDNKKKQPSI